MQNKNTLSKNSLANNDTLDQSNIDRCAKTADRIDPNNNYEKSTEPEKLEDKNKALDKNSNKNAKKGGFNLFGFLKSLGKEEVEVADRVEKNDNDEQSSGDEKLSKAFGVDLSYTRTPKIDSNNNESADIDNPDIEKSMLIDELRILKFLNDDEEEVNCHKNSTRFQNHVHSDNVKKEAYKGYTSEMSLNPRMVTVIKNQKTEIINSSTVDMKPNLNNDFGNCNQVFREDEYGPDITGMSTIHELREINTLMGYDKPDSNFSNDCDNQVNQNQNVYFTQYMPNMEISFIDDMANYNVHYDYYPEQQIYQPYYYNRAPINRRSFSKHDDKSEFDISINNIYKEKKTTLMIRNIPNKYTKELMLETIDEDFRDTYDFFYLPIDFNNNCNVGYAFINFKELKHIEPFYKKFNGKKWPIFNSEKVCSIKYARIQGKNECSKHFKGSSLMKHSVS